ncbi:hypothetical protein TcasGA2_TC034912, partial [Tribolium castaneum]
VYMEILNPNKDCMRCRRRKRLQAQKRRRRRRRRLQKHSITPSAQPLFEESVRRKHRHRGYSSNLDSSLLVREIKRRRKKAEKKRRRRRKKSHSKACLGNEPRKIYEKLEER